jgi:uncharacterized lipoprotein YajG
VKTDPHRIKFLSIGLAVVLVCGCGVVPPKVDVTYQPEGRVAKIAAPTSPPVSIEVVDNRTTQRVGENIAMFGIKTADTVTASDVPATLKNALESELKNRGFVDGAGGDAVIVRLGYFGNTFVSRSVGVIYDANASLDLEVSIVRPDGAIPYRKYVTGRARDTVTLANSANAQRMLDAAMRNALSKLFSDPDFTNTLTKA